MRDWFIVPLQTWQLGPVYGPIREKLMFYVAERGNNVPGHVTQGNPVLNTGKTEILCCYGNDAMEIDL